MDVSWVRSSLSTKFHDDEDVSRKDFEKKKWGVMLSGYVVVRWAKVNLNAVASSDSMELSGASGLIN